MAARILIVDDDVAMLQSLSDMVQIRIDHVTVDTCTSGADALTRIVEVDYDAIVSDIKMPGMDGLTLMERALTLRPTTPTLLVTGHGDHDLGVHALKVGAYAFIQKPIDRDYFVAWLRRAIQLRQLSRAVEQQNQMLERTVQERTAELERTNQNLKAALEQQRENEEVLRESEARFGAIVNQVTTGIAQTDLTGRFVLVNQRYCDIVGYSQAELLRMRMQDITHPEDLPRNAELFQRLATGDTDFVIEKRYVRKGGSLVWVNNSVAVILDAAGKARYAVAVVLDVTERKRAEEERAILLAREREARNEAETLNEVSLILGGELDLQKLVQNVTDAGTELTVAKFGAFFYNAVDEQGESYLLYTLSGAPREAFAKFGMPRNTPLFAPTFQGTGVVRIDDVLQDSRYGRNPPHRGMPQGHLPVRSYLAVPVVSRSGEVLGGLFFGHPEPGVFTERAERLSMGVAAQAAIAIDNARLYEQAQKEITERKRTEEALRRSEANLRDFIETATIGLHWVGPDGIILWANKAELDLLGYTREEYVGRHIAEFHADAPVIEDILACLSRGETLQEYGARLRCKDGSLRHVLISSSVLFEDGEFIHTRCFTRDITERKQAEAEREKLLHELQQERRRLEDSQEQLQDKIQDLEQFHDVVVGRELKLIEMETEVEKLRQQIAGSE